MLSLIWSFPIHALAQTVASTDSSSALFNAIEKGDVKSVKTILDSGGNPNAADCEGHLALNSAAQSGNLAIVNQLIVAGASVTAVDAWDDTALVPAVEFGQLEVVRYYLGEQIQTRKTLLVRPRSSVQRTMLIPTSCKR